MKVKSFFYFFRNGQISRKTSSQIEQKAEEMLVEDTSSVFNRTDGSSVGRMFMGLDTSPPPPRYLTELYESPEVAEPCEYMTPVVS